MRAVLIRLAMAIYPAAVRERYGAELEDLLAHSTRPWRDLADVGRSALGEQAATWTWDRTRPQLRRIAWLAAAPLWFGATALVLGVCGLMITAMYARDSGHDVSPAAVGGPIMLGVLGACAAIVAVAVPMPRQHRLVAPALTVPASLAAGVLGIASVPVAGDALGGARATTVLWTLGWFAVMLALGVTITVLLRRGRTGAAVAVLGAGGLGPLGLTFVLYAMAAPHLAALISALPADTGGVGAPPASTSDVGTLLADTGSVGAFAGLPAMLALCTAFTLTLVTAGAVHERPGRRRGHGILGSGADRRAGGAHDRRDGRAGLDA